MVEQVFALPGLGSLLVDSVTFRDIPVVQAEALLIAALVCLAGLVTDLSQPLLDPRLRTASAAKAAAGSAAAVSPGRPADVREEEGR
ncbi:hypothetical protein GCM10018966_015780 [Streptomyces yanii]